MRLEWTKDGEIVYVVPYKWVQSDDAARFLGKYLKQNEHKVDYEYTIDLSNIGNIDGYNFTINKNGKFKLAGRKYNDDGNNVYVNRCRHTPVLIALEIEL